MTLTEQKAPKGLTREKALDARPVKLPVLKRYDREDGTSEITVRLARPRWQRFLGSPPDVERTFKLDLYGTEVYDSCNGTKKIAAIIKDFAAAHKISQAEAELAVTAFSKTLIAKGLIAVAVDR